MHAPTRAIFPPLDPSVRVKIPLAVSAMSSAKLPVAAWAVCCDTSDIGSAAPGRLHSFWALRPPFLACASPMQCSADYGTTEDLAQLHYQCAQPFSAHVAGQGQGKVVDSSPCYGPRQTFLVKSRYQSWLHILNMMHWYSCSVQQPACI